MGVRRCAGPVGQDRPPVFPVPTSRWGPARVPARHPWGGPGLEGFDSTGFYLALAHPQRHQGCHLGHQKSAGGAARYGTPPCMRAKGNINAAGVPGDDIRTRGPGPHRKGPGRHRRWPPVDAPSPRWLREQRASGPEERGSPLSPGNKISLACSGEWGDDLLVKDSPPVLHKR
ncbi:hypothetical protein ROHU_023724 [Labeo rohita]|uniref:Uncharacterized protein n=1 Tax=Labeo rohita TaxID=84645 RepID=A0A498MR12_LABRO|nr:hypothetical protein ROHU_023724 [Labeo rohita]